jgi:hypothetical protein
LTDLDVRLLDDHAGFNWLSSTATVFRSQHPFAICVGELADWDDADTCLVVTAITRSKSNSPSGLIEVSIAEGKG